MKSFLRQHGRWLATNAVIWCLAKQLFLAIKLWGIENTLVHRFQFPLWPLFGIIALTGFLDGILFGMIDIGIDQRFRSLRFSQRVALKTLLNLFAGVTLSLILVPNLMQWYLGKEVNLHTSNLYLTQFFIITVYFLINTIMVQFFKLTIAWMKTQDILDLISHPMGVEEDRIFLFLDMKSSTALAERLETTTYSQMLQSCFQDMAEAARDTGAEIYQYVGDEAVMTWKESEVHYEKAVAFFFRFRERLSDRSSFYRERFGVVPGFKAGIHHGRVIKAQVGMMRKEIAFHGDAINTASRIQGKCAEIGRDLLISASFMEKVRDRFDCAWEGSFPIRGKSGEMNLYSIQFRSTMDHRSREEGFLLKRAIEAIRQPFSGPTDNHRQPGLEALAVDFQDINHWFV